MNPMNDQEWDNFLKAKVEEFEFPYEDKYWDLAQKQLLIHPNKPANNRKYWIWSLSLFILLISFFTIGYYWNSSLISEPSIVQSRKVFIQNSPQSHNFLQFNPLKNSQKLVKNNVPINLKKPIYAQKKSILPNHINKRKRSAQLQILSEKVSAINRTILIYKALKSDAKNYIPLENSEEFVKKLEYIPTKNLIAFKEPQELSFITQKLNKKDYVEKHLHWGVGGGIFTNKYSHQENLFFRQFISCFVQYPLSLIFYVQTLPQMSFGKHISLNKNTSTHPLAIHLPLELGIKLNRKSISAGFTYDYFFLNAEQKQDFKTSRTHVSAAFQSQYHQFLLRINAQYGLSNIRRMEPIQHEMRFLVGVYYIFPNY